MHPNSHFLHVPEVRIVPVLLFAALLQACVTLCGLWTLGLLLAAGRSQTLQDLITLCSAVSTALLKIGLHLLGI